ncbi:hypothetical protein CICLE_v10031141mg [Citrus x clementina]|uniref:DUF3444 domain-containing protein n=1 Tax=Citrus clementina TaxID=85681 RepID=V4VCX0_CITCL|nr:hypothetical protein CICLE_v10031141mg [Citrus x clementina]
MDENRIMALREIWVAKLMMHNEDYDFARDKLLTAQQLYPALDDIDSMLSACDMLLLAADEQVGLITYQASHSENNSISNLMIITLRKSNQEFYNFENNRKLENIQAGQIWAAHLQANVNRSYCYALINYNGSYELHVTWLKPIPIRPSETRWYFSGLPVGCGSFDLNPVVHDLESPMIFSHKCSPVHTGTQDQFEIYPKIGEIWALYENWNCDEWANDPQKLKGCKFDLVEMLSDFSKTSGAHVVCLEKVEAFRSVFQRQTIGQYPVIYQIPSNHLYIFSHNIPAYRLLGGDNGKVGTAIFELDQSALPDDMVHEKLDSSSGFTPSKYLPSFESSADSQLLKHTWSPVDFAIGQVWAVYCGKENMPRPYVQIVEVISASQVYVTFLEPLPVFHLDTEWKKKNLPIACGLFELGKTSVILKMSHFSHSMEYERSVTENEPHFIIYPKKGEVWAVYEDWNEEWQQNDYKNYHYYIVEILSDLLVEVENNLTFFHRQQNDGFDITCTVSQAEMFSFSHKIPAFKVQGTAIYGIPEDSWHLDPNALPLKQPRRSQ